MRAGPEVFHLHLAKILAHSRYSVIRNEQEDRENEWGEMESLSPLVLELKSSILVHLGFTLFLP